MLKTWSRFKFALLVVTSLVTATARPGWANLSQDEQNNVDVFSTASQSVVYVTNNTLVRNPYSRSYTSRPQGAGTGFIWDKAGHIVTNFHVIEGARQITITLADQSAWEADVVGLAPEKDLAVLRINAPRALLRPLPRGDSDDLQVGRKVLAIGNPFGLDTTLTVGVVSALGREIQAPNQRTIRNVIQTDAAINPGNSGGPLLNSSGELIGVNAAIYSPNGASIGIGFAIPGNTVNKIVPELIEHGHLVRPVIGIELAPRAWAQANQLPGLPILRVFNDGPADRAGLRGIRGNRFGATILGDVIVGVNGEHVANDDQLLSVLEQHKPGDDIVITVLREGSEIDVEITLDAPN